MQRTQSLVSKCIVHKDKHLNENMNSEFKKQKVTVFPRPQSQMFKLLSV